MKQCYLDVNVLVYFKDPTSSFNQNAKDLIKQLIAEETKIIISPLVIDEFLHSTSGLLRIANIKEHFRYLDQYLKSIFGIPNLEIKNPPIDKAKNRKIILFMKKYNLHPRDAYHLLIMIDHQISEFATFDNDFEKVFRRKIISHLRI